MEGLEEDQAKTVVESSEWLNVLIQQVCIHSRYSQLEHSSVACNRFFSRTEANFAMIALVQTEMRLLDSV